MTLIQCFTLFGTFRLLLQLKSIVTLFTLFLVNYVFLWKERMNKINLIVTWSKLHPLLTERSLLDHYIFSTSRLKIASYRVTILLGSFIDRYVLYIGAAVSKVTHENFQIYRYYICHVNFEREETFINSVI